MFPVGVEIVVPRLAPEIVGEKAGNVGGASEAPEIGDAGSHHSAFESPGLRDNPGSHVAAVAPTHYAEPVRIGNSIGDHLVDARHEIFVVAAAPVLDVGEPEIPTVAG